LLSARCPTPKHSQNTWLSPDRKIHNQIDRILTDKRWHSSILHVRYFRGSDYDTENYLVAAKVWEKMALIQQAAQKFNVERFNHRQLNELEVRKQYQIKISNRFAALENLSDNKDINRVWENLRANIQISSKQSLDLYEL